LDVTVAVEIGLLPTVLALNENDVDAICARLTPANEMSVRAASSVKASAISKNL
jgi:hypothetical protein